MEETTIGTTSDLIDDIGLKVNVEGTGNVFSGGSFGEESAEPVITRRGRVPHQTAIRLGKGFVRKNTYSTR